ncbi:MAG TPA: ABC transporter permease subunit [Saprospiraceae bacterium]|nr:ABC transporter permease subunit [Saprospiraceae bacterium]
MMSWLTELRGAIPKKFKIPLIIAGVVLFFLIWLLLSSGANPIIPGYALPHPSRVWNAFGDLFRDNELVRNTTISIAHNLGGYIKAILWAIPLGFLIGPLPMFRGSFQPLIDAIRFLPLTAVTSLFIVWYGIGSEMKINFLSFGIFIYLLPTVILRIDEVDDVYVKTVYTLGANKWQTIKSVFFPAVISRLFDDIRVLTAISWTYIIVAETTAATGGLGPLTFAAQRQGRVDKTFAILLLIMLIGLVQDRIFSYLDRKFFPFKYQTKPSYDPSDSLKKISVWDSILDFGIRVMGFIFLGLYVLVVINEYTGIFSNVKVLDYFFGDRSWTIHFVILSIIAFTGYGLYKKYVLKIQQ